MLTALKLLCHILKLLSNFKILSKVKTTLRKKKFSFLQKIFCITLVIIMPKNKSFNLHSLSVNDLSKLQIN